MGRQRNGSQGVLTAALLLFEILQVRRERGLRHDAEAALTRERALRVSGWIEPVMWEYERQGVVRYQPGGWKLVVSNDTDDSVTDWRAVVLTPSVQDRDTVWWLVREVQRSPGVTRMTVRSLESAAN